MTIGRPVCKLVHGGTEVELGLPELRAILGGLVSTDTRFKVKSVLDSMNKALHDDRNPTFSFWETFLRWDPAEAKATIRVGGLQGLATMVSPGSGPWECHVLMEDGTETPDLLAMDMGSAAAGRPKRFLTVEWAEAEQEVVRRFGWWWRKRLDENRRDPA